MKRAFFAYMNNWQRDFSDHIDRFRTNLLAIVHLLSIVFISLFALYHFYREMYILAFIQGIVSIVLLLNVYNFKKYKNLERTSFITIFIIFFLLVFLLLDGGVSSTGLYWAHSFPLFVIMLQGNRKGIIWVGLFYIILLGLLLLHALELWTLAYDAEKLIFLSVSVLVLTLLIYGFESLRQIYSRRLDEKHKEVVALNVKLEELARKLSKYISPQIYESLFQGSIDVKVRTQRKFLTVFFSDIVGFTKISEEIPFEETTELLNEYLDEMSTVALNHGATIDKFIGDSVMVFFGDPNTMGHKEDALACIRMAQEMQLRLKKLRAKWRKEKRSSVFHARMGIASGWCTVGNFGNKDRVDYTAFGTVVNLASRLESIADEGGIFISQGCYDLVEDEVSVEFKDAVMIRGFKEPVTPILVKPDAPFCLIK